MYLFFKLFLGVNIVYKLGFYIYIYIYKVSFTVSCCGTNFLQQDMYIFSVRSA